MAEKCQIKKRPPERIMEAKSQGGKHQREADPFVIDQVWQGCNRKA